MEHAAKLRMDSAEALRKIRTHWLARMIHDFRGPIFAARGYTKLLLDNKAGDVTVTQREYLTQVIQNINRLSDLVSTFQDFPSEEALHLDVVNLSELVICAVDALQAREETLQIERHLPPDSAITIADTAKLMLAVNKLLSVGVNFSRDRGEVQIHLRQEDGEFNIRIEATCNASRTIPASQPEADITMAADILRLHGGTVHFDSRNPNQCRISVRLPVVSFDFEEAGLRR